jgi:hypothetical protein
MSNGDAFPVVVTAASTVLSIKKAIEKSKGYHASYQAMFHEDKEDELRNSVDLSTCFKDEKADIFLMIEPNDGSYG